MVDDRKKNIGAMLNGELLPALIVLFPHDDETIWFMNVSGSS